MLYRGFRLSLVFLCMCAGAIGFMSQALAEPVSPSSGDELGRLETGQAVDPDAIPSDIKNLSMDEIRSIYGDKIFDPFDPSLPSRIVKCPPAKYESTIKIITALSGDELGRLGARQTLDLDTIPKESKNAIMDALLTLFEDITFQKQFAELQAGSSIGFELVVAPCLVFYSPEFEYGEYVIDIPGSHTSSYKDAAASMRENAKSPSLADPPGYAETMSGVSTNSAERTDWLREKAFQLLAPMGKMQLAKRNDVLLPMPASTKDAPVAISELTAQQQKWVETLYVAKYNWIVQESKPKRILRIKDDGSENEIIEREGKPVTFPLWENIRGAKVEMRLNYMLNFPVFHRDEVKGEGHFINF